jgi:hypothetical protein
MGRGGTMVGGESACVDGIAGSVHVGVVGVWWWRAGAGDRIREGRPWTRATCCSGSSSRSRSIRRPRSAPRVAQGWLAIRVEPVSYALVAGRSAGGSAGVEVSRSVHVVGSACSPPCDPVPFPRAACRCPWRTRKHPCDRAKGWLPLATVAVLSPSSRLDRHCSKLVSLQHSCALTATHACPPHFSVSFDRI